MPLWSWWFSAIALASVPIVHWLLLRRTLAVSGRYSALVDRLRFGAAEGGDLGESDQAALIEALRAQTAADFGDDALDEVPDASSTAPAPLLQVPDGAARHTLFLVGLGLGGALSAMLAGQLALHAGLRGETFAAVVAQLPVPAEAVLVCGGLFVGFGTRMASGCTSGHGLCGVSQLQRGSLASTAAFFGAGVATSFALGALL